MYFFPSFCSHFSSFSFLLLLCQFDQSQLTLPPHWWQHTPFGIFSLFFFFTYTINGFFVAFHTDTRLFLYIWHCLISFYHILLHPRTINLYTLNTCIRTDVYIVISSAKIELYQLSSMRISTSFPTISFAISSTLGAAANINWTRKVSFVISER